MQSFKEFLSEAKIDFAPWMISTQPELRDWVLRNHMKKFNWTDEGLDAPYGQEKMEGEAKGEDLRSWAFNKNGTITFRASKQPLNGTDLLNTPEGVKIPYQIQNAKELVIRAQELVSAWGLPLKAVALTIDSAKLQTLDHLNSDIKETLSLKLPGLNTFGDCKVKADGLFFSACGMKSMSGVHKHFELSHYIAFNSTPQDGDLNMFESHILGIMLIKGGLTKCTMNYGFNKPNKLSPFGQAIGIIEWNLTKPDPDVMDVQEELIQAGLKEFAKL